MKQDNSSADQTGSLLAWPHWQIALLAFGGLIGLVGVVLLVARFWPGGVDYYYQYYPVSRKWLVGQTQLYDAESMGYFHPPWTLWITLLFTVWPYEIGRALLWVATIAIVVCGIVVFSRPGWGRLVAFVTALFNLHTFDLLFRGQIDGFNVLGVILGWMAWKRHAPWLMGLAYVSLMVKLPNGIPAAALLFIMSALNREWRETTTSIATPLSLALSTLIVFPGWPWRWPDVLRQSPPPHLWETSIWHTLGLYHLPMIIGWLVTVVTAAVCFWVWLRTQELPDLEKLLARLMIIVAATFVVTPYSLSYHYVLLMAVVIPYIARYSIGWVIALYLLTFLPILRAFIGPEYAWIDYLFVIAVFAVTIRVVMKSLLSVRSHARQQLV